MLSVLCSSKISLGYKAVTAEQGQLSSSQTGLQPKLRVLHKYGPVACCHARQVLQPKVFLLCSCLEAALHAALS